jgi:hypothetical protein
MTTRHLGPPVYHTWWQFNLIGPLEMAVDL